jgi:arabinogalactan oligomer / maltooligosaccharide transport system substrate-binding protein/arabinogalactan oligomer / maltooligosaccharide transport system permease protein
MKRALALIVLLVLALAAPAAAEPLSLWHSYRGEEQAALDGLIEAWNEAHPDQPVQPLSVPHEAYANKLTAAIPRDQGPDLFIFAHERVGDWARSGLVRALDAEVSEAQAAAFFPVTIEALRYEGKLYGVPLAYKTVALIYNKALIAEPPRSTDAMVALLEQTTDPLSRRFGLAYEAGSFYHHAGWLFGFGGRLFDDAGRAALDDPANVASVAFVADLMRRKLLPEEPTGALVTQLFNDNRAAMVINGPWMLGEIDPSIDFGVATLPVVSTTGLSARPFLTVEAALVSSHASDPAAALALANFLATGRGARERLERGKQLVAERAAYDAEGLNIDPHLLAFRAQIDTAMPMPNNPLMRSVWEPAAQALRSALRGSITPAAAMTKAQHDLKVVTRPAPPAKDPAPYVAVALLLLAVGLLVAALRARGQGAWRAAWKNRHAYAYLLPTALGLLLLVLVPFLVGTAVAFFAHKSGEFTFVGLANFVNILSAHDYAITDPLSFYFTLAVTVGWTAVNVALHVSLGLALAMLLRNEWLKLRGVYRVLLIIPWAVPNYITALIWKGMFHSQFGAINGLLTALGLEPVSWFSHFWTAFAANVTTNTWLGFPFMMVVALGALQAIPRDLEEAALMDGAGSWTRFTRVILPQIRPALVPAVVLGSVWTFNMFNIIYLVSAGEPDGATEILISEAYRWAFTRQEQYGYAAAYATLIFLTLIVYSRLTRRVTGGEEIE